MSTPIQWLTNTRDWLDSHGKGAWIAAMVLGFIIFGPLGLILLFYMIGTNRMKSFSCRRNYRHRFNSTGNVAFDNYRDETLKRLEDEQANFGKFMEQLRAAKDKAEFDQFMDSRAKQNFDTDPVPPAPTPAPDSEPRSFGGATPATA